MSNCPLHTQKEQTEEAKLIRSALANPPPPNCGTCLEWDIVSERCRREEELINYTSRKR